MEWMGGELEIAPNRNRDSVTLPRLSSCVLLLRDRGLYSPSARSICPPLRDHTHFSLLIPQGCYSQCLLDGGYSQIALELISDGQIPTDNAIASDVPRVCKQSNGPTGSDAGSKVWAAICWRLVVVLSRCFDVEICSAHDLSGRALLGSKKRDPTSRAW